MNEWRTIDTGRRRYRELAEMRSHQLMLRNGLVVVVIFYPGQADEIPWRVCYISWTWTLAQIERSAILLPVAPDDLLCGGP